MLLPYLTVIERRNQDGRRVTLVHGGGRPSVDAAALPVRPDTDVLG